MSITDAPLVPLDEYMNHQITDTFASVSQSDRCWTEKVCLSVGAKDGSVVDVEANGDTAALWSLLDGADFGGDAAGGEDAAPLLGSEALVAWGADAGGDGAEGPIGPERKECISSSCCIISASSSAARAAASRN